MKQFISFVRKEFYHIFRDKRTMLILLGMPIIQMLLFGFAISTEVKNTQVAVFDPAKDASTRLIKEHLQASKYFDLAAELTDIRQINDAFKDGEIGLVVVFCAHFAESLPRGEASIQLITDGTDPNQASMITAYASNILSSCRQELSGGDAAPSAGITPEIRMLYNPQGESAYNFVPGVMGVILMLVGAMMTSIAIVRERETGTMEVLLASPMKPHAIVLAKMLPYLALSAVNLAAILLLSTYVLNVPIVGSLGLLIVVSILFVILTLSLGLFISNMVSSQMAAMLASGMGLMMPTVMLSGLIFPIGSMPPVLQGISAFVPARWFTAAVRKIMIQGADFRAVTEEIALLALMTVVLIGVSLRCFKTRLH
ncbi:MAG: ABC transporter permease [Bacteroidaceae bacterium]|jgi:ABC-2 type transport system permease protein